MPSMTGRSQPLKAPRRPLPEPMQNRLREGSDTDPHGVQMSVVLSMRQHGWEKRDVLTAMLDKGNGAGRWTRQTRNKKGLPAARAEVRALVAKADAYIAASPPVTDRHDAVASLALLRACADREPWAGQTGTTDRVVLESLLTLAERSGGPAFRASERQIAEQANRSRSTVVRCLPRLVGAGWLNKGTTGAGEQGTSLRLTRPASETSPVPRQGKRVTTGLTTLAGLNAHDACSTGCLGASGARVLALIFGSEEALTAQEMSDVLGLSVDSVRKRLVRIHSAGLAVVADDRSWAPVSLDEAVVQARLDWLALRTGRAGTQEAQRVRHAEQRAPYLVWVQGQEDARFDAKRRASMHGIDGGRSQEATPGRALDSRNVRESNASGGAR